MKFKIKRTVLLSALSKISRAVSMKSPLPVLTGIKFDLSDTSLTLTGSDSDIAIQTIITNDLEIEKPGSVVLSSKYILEIIKKIDSEEVDITIVDGTLTKIEGASSKFSLNGTPSQEYPRIDLNHEGIHLMMKAYTLKQVIEKTVFATSEKETRPVLTGVNFKAKDNSLTCIATDSFRLAQNTITLDEDQSFNIIIPKKSLNEISKIIENDDNIDIYVSDRKVLFVIDDYTILSRLIDGSYPDTSRLISGNSLQNMFINSSHLLAAVDRASLLSDETTNIVKLNMNANDVILSSGSQEIGTVEEKLANATFYGEDLEISFSAKYLADAIRSINTQNVKLSFSGRNREILITDEKDNSNIQVILPVRTY